MNTNAQSTIEILAAWNSLVRTYRKNWLADVASFKILKSHGLAMPWEVAKGA